MILINHSLETPIKIGCRIRYSFNVFINTYTPGHQNWAGLVALKSWQSPQAFNMWRSIWRTHICKSYTNWIMAFAFPTRELSNIWKVSAGSSWIQSFLCQILWSYFRVSFYSTCYAKTLCIALWVMAVAPLTMYLSLTHSLCLSIVRTLLSLGLDVDGSLASPFKRKYLHTLASDWRMIHWGHSAWVSLLQSKG